MGRTFENMPPVGREEGEESPSMERSATDARGEGDSMSPSAGTLKTEGGSSTTRSKLSCQYFSKFSAFLCVPTTTFYGNPSFWNYLNIDSHGTSGLFHRLSFK